MADLPSGPPAKVNDVEVAQDAPVTEALLNKMGVDLNYLIDNIDLYQTVKLKTQLFTANGNFTVPDNTDKVLIIGCGGGGGGGGGPGTNTSSGSDGGDGAPIGVYFATVTPAAVISVTIGGGGGGGAASGSATGTVGSDGGDTSFGGLVTFKGAKGGGAGQAFGFGTGAPTGLSVAQSNQIMVNRYNSRTVDHRGVAGSALGGHGGFNFTNNNAGRQDGFKGQASIYADGGNGGTKDPTSKSGGGGGGASLGAGGVGGDGGVNNATAGGTGAGGGGGCSSSPNGGAGASGGSGVLLVVWVAV